MTQTKYLVKKTYTQTMHYVDEVVVYANSPKEAREKSDEFDRLQELNANGEGYSYTDQGEPIDDNTIEDEVFVDDKLVATYSYSNYSCKYDEELYD